MCGCMLGMLIGREYTDGIIFAEGEFQSVGLIEVERVGVIQDADVHLPFFEVFCFHYGDSRG